MIINNFDTEKSVYVIAEVGNNHEGNFNLAQEMIGLASETGANAVKFQTFIPEHYVSASDTDRMKRLETFMLSYDHFKSLSEFANQTGIDFISTPFDLKSAIFLNEIQNVFKISSGDNSFYPLIGKIAEFGKPIIISTGLSDIEEINKTVSFIHDSWSSNQCTSDIALLHCVTSYPVPLEYANLSMIRRLKEKFNRLTVGYSDHTLGIEAAIHSVSYGARIIEKHFTIDKNFSSFRDHQLSADPKEMKEMILRVKDAEKMIGDPNHEFQSIEADIKVAVRRSIAASNPIKKGEIIKKEDITWVRPGIGFKPGEENKVIGKISSKEISKGDIILDAHIR